ncbi:MAG: DUF2892 domain-containing protein [Deltaproteobacteria bacterium]|nr:DUF2892 domain-containing protein [Deltaproteobacteria bacterium]MCL5276660.1 DUF2892 domain-containing protein [Deltaproteobacteria bacterium]
MKKNVGSADRVVRWVIGLILLSMVFWVNGPWRWIGLIGFLPLLTGSINWCPLYSALGISTSKKGPPDSQEGKDKPL